MGAGLAVTALVALGAVWVLIETPGVSEGTEGDPTHLATSDLAPGSASATPGVREGLPDHPATNFTSTAAGDAPRRLEIPTVAEAHRAVVDDGLGISQRVVEFVGDLERLDDVLMPRTRRRDLVLERVKTFLDETFAAGQVDEAPGFLAEARARADEARAGVALARAALGGGAVLLADIERLSWDWKADVIAAAAWDPLRLAQPGLSMPTHEFSLAVLERREELLSFEVTRPPDPTVVAWARGELKTSADSSAERRIKAAALLVLGTGLDRRPDVVVPILRDAIRRGEPGTGAGVGESRAGAGPQTVWSNLESGLQVGNKRGDRTTANAALWVLARGSSPEARAALGALLRDTADVEGLAPGEAADRMVRLVGFARALAHDPPALDELAATLRDPSASVDDRLRAVVSLLGLTQVERDQLDQARAAQAVLAGALADEKDDALAFAELGALSMSLEYDRLSRGLSIGFGSAEAPSSAHEERVRVALEKRLLHDLRPQHRALAALALRDFATEPAASRALDTLRAALHNESDAGVRERIRIALGNDG